MRSVGLGPSGRSAAAFDVWPISLSLYIYTYMYVCMYVCMYIYIYIYTYDDKHNNNEIATTNDHTNKHMM